MNKHREVYKTRGDKSSLHFEVWWKALQSRVTLRTESAFRLSLGRGKNPLAVSLLCAFALRLQSQYLSQGFFLFVLQLSVIRTREMSHLSDITLVVRSFWFLDYHIYIHFGKCVIVLGHMYNLCNTFNNFEIYFCFSFLVVYDFCNHTLFWYTTLLFSAYLSFQRMELTCFDELVWLHVNYLSSLVTHETVHLFSFFTT